MSTHSIGTLYIVATPIGNREDISFRALSTLQTVDLILAEDTRHSRPLLTALGIKKPMLSLHAHNEASQSGAIIARLEAGITCALISDAGTPLISDPGYPLVHQAQAKGIPVIPIPGACALITALSAAGVACESFSFYGFLPAKRSARVDTLQSLQSIEHTLVFYESTHRLLECLDDLAQVFGDTLKIVLAKELTKTFERFMSGSIGSIKTWLLADPRHTKGEFVLILPPRAAKPSLSSEDRLLSVLLAELPLKQAVKIASQLSDHPKNELYALALTLQKEFK